MQKRFYITLTLMFGLLLSGHAQSETQTEEEDTTKSKNEDLIQFSGVLLGSDSLEAVPFANVYEKSSRTGTSSDYFGYFSFVAEMGDTIVFRSMGYKDAEFVIPDTLTGFRYSIIQMMIRDTVELEPVDIFPWPSKEEFADAFVNDPVPDDQYEVARQNLRRAELAAYMQGVPNDGYLNYKWQMYQHQQRLYYAGQAPPINLLNPLAWAKFIDAWKKGKFKQEEYDPTDR